MQGDVSPPFCIQGVWGSHRLHQPFSGSRVCTRVIWTGVTLGDAGNRFALGLGWVAADSGSQVGFQKETSKLQYF